MTCISYLKFLTSVFQGLKGFTFLMSICLQAEYSTRTIPSIPKILCCVIPGFLPFYPPFKHQQEQVILIAAATGLRSDTHSGQRSSAGSQSEHTCWRERGQGGFRGGPYLPSRSHPTFCSSNAETNVSDILCGPIEPDRMKKLKCPESSAQLQHINTKGAVKQFEVLRRPQSSQEVFHHNRNL